MHIKAFVYVDGKISFVEVWSVFEWNVTEWERTKKNWKRQTVFSRQALDYLGEKSTI